MTPAKEENIVGAINQKSSTNILRSLTKGDSRMPKSIRMIKALLYGAGIVGLVWFISPTEQDFVLMELNMCAVGIGAILYLETTR